MATYRPRVIDDELNVLLRGLPAIAIEGAKAVGKTATATQHATTVFKLENPDQRALLEADPSLVTTAEPPVLIDEWQHVPAVWDAVRRAVDDDPNAHGRFLFTGSATPKKPPTHSGAGRIVTLRMTPMTLSEPHERDRTGENVAPQAGGRLHRPGDSRADSGHRGQAGRGE